MNILQSIYSKLSAIFAVIPGITILTTNIGVPPSSSKLLYGGIIEAIGTITILLLWSNKELIIRMNRAKINRIVIVLICFFLVSLVSYLILFDSYVIYSSEYERSIFFPFWLNENLNSIIISAGSKHAAISNYGPQAIIDEIFNTSHNYLILTNIIFLVIYISIFESLVLGFSILGIKAAPNNFV